MMQAIKIKIGPGNMREGLSLDVRLESEIAPLSSSWEYLVLEGGAADLDWQQGAIGRVTFGSSTTLPASRRFRSV